MALTHLWGRFTCYQCVFDVCQISQISNHILCCKEPSGSKNLNTCDCAALIYRVWKLSRDYSPCFPGFWYQLSCRLVKTSFTFVVFHLRLDSGAFQSAAVLSPRFLLSFCLDFWCRVDSCSWTRSKLCRIPMESASGWAKNMFAPFCKGPVCLNRGWKRAWNHLVRELRRVWLSLLLLLRRAVLGFGVFQEQLWVFLDFRHKFNDEMMLPSSTSSLIILWIEVINKLQTNQCEDRNAARNIQGPWNNTEETGEAPTR